MQGSCEAASGGKERWGKELKGCSFDASCDSCVCVMVSSHLGVAQYTIDSITHDQCSAGGHD